MVALPGPREGSIKITVLGVPSHAVALGLPSTSPPFPIQADDGGIVMQCVQALDRMFTMVSFDDAEFRTCAITLMKNAPQSWLAFVSFPVAKVQNGPLIRTSQKSDWLIQRVAYLDSWDSLKKTFDPSFAPEGKKSAFAALDNIFTQFKTRSKL
jgi:hypothetical protein